MKPTPDNREEVKLLIEIQPGDGYTDSAAIAPRRKANCSVGAILCPDYILLCTDFNSNSKQYRVNSKGDSDRGEVELNLSGGGVSAPLSSRKGPTCSATLVLIL